VKRPDFWEVTQATDNGLGDIPGSLSWPIKQANNAVGLDTIKLKTNVRLAFADDLIRMKTLINSDMIIDGQTGSQYVISGDNNNNGQVDEADRPIFFVYGGNEKYQDYNPAVFTDKGSNGIVDVTFKNLTLKGGVAQGGQGSAGMGGALFIYDGNVTLEQVTFDSNSHYGKSGRIMGRMKFETIEHEREKMLPAIKINITS
jgi:hypothetical protein